jgi:uncharacterized protein YegJ (DUF2314 family)
MTIQRFGLAGLVIAAALMGPSAVAQKPPTQGDQVTMHSADDARMNAARAEARRRLPEFFAALSARATTDDGFVLKYDLNLGRGDPEFIWANNIQVQGDRITGNLANAPVNNPRRLGEAVTIPRNLIVDWGFFRNGVMQGSFTTRVQLEQLDPRQAAEIRRNLGW